MMERIFFDTNVLISAIVFDKNELDCVILSVRYGKELIISEHVLEESRDVIQRKFPDHAMLFELFLRLSGIIIINRSRYESLIGDYPDIRDIYDAHVLACAKAEECDIILSGDKDLHSYQTSEIRILRPADYLKEIQ